MKITDAIATLNILEESLNLLAEARLQEMEMFQAAAAIIKKPDPIAAMNMINLGNLTYNGNRLEGIRAVQAFDQALIAAKAPMSVRTAANKKMKMFWREIDPETYDRDESKLTGLRGTRPAPQPAMAGRPIGVVQQVAPTTRQAISQMDTDERAALAKKFQKNLARKPEQKRRRKATKNS
jgi:hypothetical protein